MIRGYLDDLQIICAITDYLCISDYLCDCRLAIPNGNPVIMYLPTPSEKSKEDRPVNKFSQLSAGCGS